MSANLTIVAVDDLDGDMFGTQARTGSVSGGFPSTAILDNFNRANEGPPLSANWDGPLRTSESISMVVSGNQAVGTVAGTGSNWWKTSYGPGSGIEVYAKVVTVGGDGFGLAWNIATPNTAGIDGYWFQQVSAGTIRISRIDDGGFTPLGADISLTVSDGDSVGISHVGSTITLYYKSGAGAWGIVDTRTDGTYSSGFIALRCANSTSTVWDDFGGGTL